MVWVEIRARAKPLSSLFAAVWESNRSACRERKSAHLLQLGLAGQTEVTPHGPVALPHFSEDSNWSYSVICLKIITELLTAE